MHPHPKRAETAKKPFGVSRRAGRFVQIWAMHIETVVDVRQLGGEFHHATAGVVGPLVACVDFSRMQSLPQAILDDLVAAIQSVTSRIERSAYILPRAGTVLWHQMEHCFRRAPHPSRRICSDGAE